jgi:hypothetical protein
MTGPFDRRSRGKRSRLATAALGLLFLLGMTSSGRADDPAQRLTPEQRKEEYPRGHRDLALSLNNLGSLLQSQGAYDEALPLCEQGVDMQQGLADILLAATSEAEAMNYLAQLPGARDGLISASLHVPDSDAAVYDRVWRGKAAVARMLQRRQAAQFHLSSTEPATRRTIEVWRDIRGQLARLMLAAADGRDHPERLQQIQQLTAEKERLERVLAGANRPTTDVDPSMRDDLGILTAESIDGLPLQDLELVVLSACEIADAVIQMEPIPLLLTRVFP